MFNVCDSSVKPDFLKTSLKLIRHGDIKDCKMGIIDVIKDVAMIKIVQLLRNNIVTGYRK